MRSLTLYTTQQRPPVIDDNFVFIYDPVNHFTPNNPFPSICDITHLWYRLTAVHNGWHYFDFKGLLCKWVSATVIPLQIKLQYRGTYLLYSPPTPGPHTLTNNQQPSLGSSGMASQTSSAQASMLNQAGILPVVTRSGARLRINCHHYPQQRYRAKTAGADRHSPVRGRRIQSVR